MDKNFLISVIVPAYNIAEYLPRCLDSILNQTYSNLEVIVISDGSTDNTNEIIKEYANIDSRIVPVFKENTGVSDTRNKGLEMAKGGYIGFVDGDDFIEPNMYELLLKNAIENDADISHCGYQMVFPSRVDYYYNTGKIIKLDRNNGLIELIKANYFEPSICNKIYKKEILQNISLNINLIENEDLLFNVQAFMNCNKSIYEDKPLYHYILRKNSACTSSFNIKKTDNQILVLEIIDNFLKESVFKNIISKRYIEVLVNNYRITCMESVPKEEYRQKLKTVYRKYNNKDISVSKKAEIYLILKLKSLYKIMARLYSKYFYNNPYEVK